MNGLLTWIEQRTGLVSQTTDFLTEDVPGGASYWYVFGSATIFCMILQIVTGIFLTFYYAPSTASAWESTKYIYDHVPLGWFVIGLHYWGATAMIALLFMHMLQTLLWGAYKAPREMMWVLGILMLVFTLVLGLTGYLLPWDMNAYFASQVAINIASSVPILGTATQQMLSGGPGMGTLTINRFFGIHVWGVPALLILFAVGHLVIFRHNGAAGPPEDVADRKKLPQGRFWPDQLFMDGFASFLIFIVIVLLAIFQPPGLDQKADPSQKFIAYPAWYFLALYGMLRLAGQTGSLVPIANLFATVIIPGGLVTLLILLPWIDRNPSRSLARRPWIVGLTALSIVIAVGLSIFSQLAIQQEQAEAKSSVGNVAAQPVAGANGAAGSNVAGSGGPAASGHGAQVFANNCSTCHGAQGAGVPGAFPPLAGNAFVVGDADKVIHVVAYGLSGPVKVNGTTYNGAMPDWKGKLSDADIASVITFVRTSWGNKGTPVSVPDVAKVKK